MTSQSVRVKLALLPQRLANIYSAASALLVVIEDQEREALDAIAAIPAEPLDIPAFMVALQPIVENYVGLPFVKSLLATIQAAPDYAEAMALIHPLDNELTAALKAEASV